MKVDLYELLKKNGFKITHSRRKILETLSSKPMSVQEIQEILKRKGIRTDIVTIYRNIDLLIKIGIVEKTQFGDKTARYEIVTGKSHHHHLICENCGSVEDIGLNEDVLVKQVANQSRFKIRRHSLEFFGYCNGCQLQ